MAAIDFPNSPTTGQLFTVGDITWEWTGTVWQGQGTPIAGPAGADGADGAAGADGADGEPGVVTATAPITYDSETQTVGLDRSQLPSSGNAIINGAFEINQRNFTSSTANGYGFDRWNFGRSGGTVTGSAQTFTPGSGPAAGIEPRNFFRGVTDSQSASSHYSLLIQSIEDVRSFAGQTVTLSFYAKAGSGTPKIAGEFYQYFGTGGSPSSTVSTPIGAATISTSWARYSLTFAVPSISGKTIGTNNDSALTVNLWFSGGADFATRASSIGIQNNTFDIWGVQLEAGSTATPFRRNANSLQGELAACQRYYQRFVASSAYGNIGGFGWSVSTTAMNNFLEAKTTLRSVPTSLDFGGSLQIQQTNNSTFSVSNITLNTAECSVNKVALSITHSSATANLTGSFRANNDATAFVGFSSEL